MILLFLGFDGEVKIVDLNFIFGMLCGFIEQLVIWDSGILGLQVVIGLAER